MSNTEKLKQGESLGEIEPSVIAIKESAGRLGVSVATIRNWIRAKYLERAGRGLITLESLRRFQSDVSGKDKLVKRANKSLKDSHDHDKTASRFLDRVALSIGGADEIGARYEASLSESYRNKSGVYYTPADVVRDLFAVPRAKGADSDRFDVQDAIFCDPCCGSGNFVVRAIESGFKPENIHGYDIDPIAVEITRARIYQAAGYRSKNIKVADFLDVACRQGAPSFDYIYTNPPWGGKTAKKARESIGLRLGAGASIDTCSLFFFACLRCLRHDGVLGLLLPESFFNIAVFEDARAKALGLAIERLVDYGKVFKGLVTGARAIVLRKRPADSGAGISCESAKAVYRRSVESFLCNPRSILNLYCNEEDALTLQHLMSIPFVTLKDRASWGLGIVTGNNRKFIKPKPRPGYIPVYKGSDISHGRLKEADSFIPSDMSLYQQVAPARLYEAREKLIYRFISSRLCFFHDDRQRYVLNSANILIPDDSFQVSAKVLAELLSSDFMNWLFSRVFNTHKILRGDLESLPIHSQFIDNPSGFDEKSYLDRLGIARDDIGNHQVLYL